MCFLPLIKTPKIVVVAVYTSRYQKYNKIYEVFEKIFLFLKSILSLQVYPRPIEWESN